MSQFFKALEKAERDRQRIANGEGPRPAVVEDEAEASTPAPASPRPAAATAAAPPRRESDTAATSPVVPLRPVAPTPAGSPEEPPRPAAAQAPSAWPSPRAAQRAVRAFERAGRKPSKSWTKPAKSRDSAALLVADLEPNSVATEAYRTLRVNIEFMLKGQKCRNVVITSPSQGEGKSTTAANLAVVSAQAGWRVCLVEADVRRPVLHAAFGLPNRGGLAKALSEELPLSAVALPTEFPGLSVVVAGDYDPEQTDLFSSSRIQQVRRDIESHYDLVLWDTPPVILVADALNLVAQCDGVILVVRSGGIPYSVLRRAGRQIAQVKGKILGVLLNRIDLRRTDQEFYGYYHAYHKDGDDRQP
jgi:protein-tyrosine kinase